MKSFANPLAILVMLGRNPIWKTIFFLKLYIAVKLAGKRGKKRGVGYLIIVRVLLC